MQTDFMGQIKADKNTYKFRINKYSKFLQWSSPLSCLHGCTIVGNTPTNDIYDTIDSASDGIWRLKHQLQ